MVRTSLPRPASMMRLALFALCALCVACSTGKAKLSARFAPGFAPAHHSVSVFGVYKDGQMSAEAWNALAPRLSSWFRTTGCRAGYEGESAVVANRTLWSAVDDYTRSDGPTDDLLSVVSQAARGDLVLVLTVAGRVPEETKARVQDESPQAAQSAGKAGLGAMRNGGGQMFHNPSLPAGAADALELAALVYSVGLRASVAQVSLEYSGNSVDDAFAQFVAKLRESLPDMACTGWNWEGTVDAEAIRKLGE
jgi:hypothetical protein